MGVVGPEVILPKPSTFHLRPFSDLSSIQRQEIADIYRDSYGGVGLWIGDQTYESLTVPTTTDVATVEVGGKIGACINLNGKRAGIIAVGAEFRSQGFVSDLFQGLKKQKEGVWISISIAEQAKPMLASATAKDVPLIPVNDPAEIQRLFEETRQLRGPKGYVFEQVENEFLTRRLSRKGIKQEVFTAVAKTNALHPESYQQIVFQAI